MAATPAACDSTTETAIHLWEGNLAVTQDSGSLLILTHTRYEKLNVGPMSQQQLGNLNVICIRDGALRAFAEETGSLPSARDFVMISTTHPSAKEAAGFTTQLTEIPFAIVWSAPFASASKNACSRRSLRGIWITCNPNNHQD